MKRYVFIVFIGFIIFQISACRNYDWILDCSRHDYFDRLEKPDISKNTGEAISKEIKKMLPDRI